MGLERLLRVPLVVAGTPAAAEQEVSRLLAARGMAARVRASVDNPQTLVALVRAGVGVGVANAVALGPLNVCGLIVREVEGDVLAREVAADLARRAAGQRVGRDLHHAVVEVATPVGATPPGVGTGVLPQAPVSDPGRGPAPARR